MLPEISDQKKSEGLNRLIESNHLLQEDNKYFLKTIYDTELAVSNHIKRLMVPIEDHTN